MTGIFLFYIKELVANNGTMPEERFEAFKFIFYLLAEWREAKAFRPLIEALRIDEDDLDLLIGDGITTMAWRAIYSVFDGDFAPIILAIHDENTYEFIRSGMFQTLSEIAKHTPSHRPKIISILKDFYNEFYKGEDAEENFVWVGWASCIADIGASEFLPLVHNAFNSGQITPIGWNKMILNNILSKTMEKSQRRLSGALNTKPLKYQVPLKNFPGGIVFQKKPSMENKNIRH